MDFTDPPRGSDEQQAGDHDSAEPQFHQHHENITTYAQKLIEKNFPKSIEVDKEEPQLLFLLPLLATNFIKPTILKPIIQIVSAFFFTQQDRGLYHLVCDLWE